MDPISRLELRQYTKDEYTEEELNKLDVSSDECDSEEEECVDILSTSPGIHHCSSPGPDDSDQSRIEEETTHNNFSIDRILGIQKERKKDEDKKDDKCIRPTPLPIIPRASKSKILIDLYIFNSYIL